MQTEVIPQSSKRKPYNSFLKDHIMGKISVLLELCLIVIDSIGKKKKPFCLLLSFRETQASSRVRENILCTHIYILHLYIYSTFIYILHIGV